MEQNRGPRNTSVPIWSIHYGKGYKTTCFPSSSLVKEPTCNEGDAGDTGSNAELGRSPGGRNDSPLTYSCWEIPQRSLMGYSLQGCKESATPEQMHFTHIPDYTTEKGQSLP